MAFYFTCQLNHTQSRGQNPSRHQVNPTYLIPQHTIVCNGKITPSPPFTSKSTAPHTPPFQGKLSCAHLASEDVGKDPFEAGKCSLVHADLQMSEQPAASPARLQSRCDTNSSTRLSQGARKIQASSSDGDLTFFMSVIPCTFHVPSRKVSRNNATQPIYVPIEGLPSMRLKNTNTPKRRLLSASHTRSICTLANLHILARGILRARADARDSSRIA